jgi:hypothetical protein
LVLVLFFVWLLKNLGTPQPFNSSLLIDRGGEGKVGRYFDLKILLFLKVKME